MVHHGAKNSSSTGVFHIPGDAYFSNMWISMNFYIGKIGSDWLVCIQTHPATENSPWTFWLVLLRDSYSRITYSYVITCTGNNRCIYTVYTGVIQYYWVTSFKYKGWSIIWYAYIFLTIMIACLRSINIKYGKTAKLVIN